MRIFIRPPDKTTKKDDIEIDLNPDELIESVRKRIHEKKGIECHKMMYKGTNLHDERTLRSYDVLEGSVLIVQGQYYGQYLPMGVTPQMEKRKAEEISGEPLVELAPEAKRVAAVISEQNIVKADIPWIGARSAVHGEKGMRRQMEDEHLICASLREQCPGLSKERNFALFGIFDGHGGKQVAGFIKTYLAVELGNAFAAEEPKDGSALTDKNLKRAVEATFQRLDSRIATELTGCYDGCTASIVLVNADTVLCLNLGDSMAYLCRVSAEEEQQAIPLQMRQHKCWMMKEKERILRAGGAVENGRINGVLEVSRAFGDITLKKFGVLCTPEYMKFKIDREKDQFLLVGCDGFWNAWTAAEAIDFVFELVESEKERAQREGDGVDMQSVCRQLVQHVIDEKKAQDNVSVLLVEFMKEVSEQADVPLIDDA